MRIHEQFNWTRLTDDDGHFLFGYYDRCPWDADSQRHLALRVGQQDALPAPGETAEVGFVDRQQRRFVKLTDTQAWNHQQGAMTLWLMDPPGAFVFNDFALEGDAWRPIARVMDTDGRELGRYDTHIYAISEDGRWGATIDFGRIPRRGYSYALAPKPEAKLPDMDTDGLFRVDMRSGEKTLIVPYREFFALHPFPWDGQGHYYWLNHVTFNVDGSRLMVLFRHEDHDGAMWRTHVFTVGVDGTDLRCPIPGVYWISGRGVTHQMWTRQPDEILLDAGWFDRPNAAVVVRDAACPHPARRVSQGLGLCSHMIHSPDGRWIATDSYPQEDGFQYLGLIDVATGRCTQIGRFRHHAPGRNEELRCDLHPRWSRDGLFLTVDSIHEGDRRIFMLEMAPVFEAIRNNQQLKGAVLE